MAFNFVAIHAAIKAVINAANFQYVSLGDWGSFEDRFFPDGLINRGYSINLNSMINSEFEEINRNRIFATIEFILDTQDDLYLQALDDAVAAVASLSGITASSLCNVVDDGNLKDFVSIEIPKTGENIGSKVVQFTNIRIEIEA